MKFVVDPKRLIWVVLLLIGLTSCTELKEDDFAHAYRDAIWQFVISNEISVSNISVDLQQVLTDKTLPALVTSLDWEDLIENANMIARDSTDVLGQLTVEQVIELRSHLKRVLARVNIALALADLITHVKLIHQFGSGPMTDLHLSNLEKRFAETHSRIEEAEIAMREIKDALSKP